MGERFKYLVGECLADSVFGREGRDPLKIEAYDVFEDLTVAVPEALRGQLERPSWLFGRWAIDGDEDFYLWLNKALDPREDRVLRVHFPGSDCGLDIVLVPRSLDKHAPPGV